MHRIVLGIEYDGSHFSGWQRQDNRRTVQGEMEKSLSLIANQKIKVQCAGRTDTGVHALEQVVHFDTDSIRTHDNWIRGGNRNLPADIRILWAKWAIDDFHARYSAVARYYRYVFLNRSTNSALQHSRVSWCHHPLAEVKMHIAAQSLIGHHDFSSFRALSCQSASPDRLMHFINVFRQADEVVIELVANAFLHHMVRNIAGVLMAIGTGKQSIDWVQELLDIKDRRQGGITAPPYGLYLGGVYYPEKYKINKHSAFNKLPADACRFAY
ncbi:MAG: tRNA pseudouridine(38-40) synthase TruA [Methylococcales symbiont of Iophon sp. n. MRB-2018]|nr:MAG: tRNA pseudouridine(38-40) synthase TruA [Methylococcales symbiont of Iophon sp. n. MRB-2018]KAF3979209.1 MAG: tRNA pseudouridine(38-40) synthase TruA [Methylococcales symbiont of Iophon sp. n. MRB-2018]